MKWEIPSLRKTVAAEVAEGLSIAFNSSNNISFSALNIKPK